MKPHTEHDPAAVWRPPGWKQIEEGVDPTPETCVELYEDYKKAKYYTRGGALSDLGKSKADADEAATVRFNEALLRDAWNTHPGVWGLGEQLIGRPFLVDPFNNPGTVGLEHLKVMLDGRGDQDDDERPTNGLAAAKSSIEFDELVYKQGKVEQLATQLPEPLNWRRAGKRQLKRGGAPAAVNGPHSCTEKWLKLCVAHGQHDICAAFVPDNGDAWFQRWGLTAQLVIRLGRVPCGAPPALKASSPRGASALLVWIPEPLIAGTHKSVQACISKGRSFRVPWLMRPLAGVQYAFVQPGACRDVVDMKLVS